MDKNFSDRISLKVACVIDPTLKNVNARTVAHAVFHWGACRRHGLFPLQRNISIYPIQVRRDSAGWVSRVSTAFGFEAGVEKALRMGRESAMRNECWPRRRHGVVLYGSTFIDSGKQQESVERIVSFCERQKIDLMVVCTGGRGWTHFFVSDWIQPLLVESTVPAVVINVRTKACPTANDIVYPVSHPESPEAFDAFNVGLQLARSLQKKLVVFYKPPGGGRPRSEVVFYAPKDFERRNAQLGRLEEWMKAARAMRASAEIHVDERPMTADKALFDYCNRSVTTHFVLADPSFSKTSDHGFSVHRLSRRLSKPVWVAYPLTQAFFPQESLSGPVQELHFGRINHYYKQYV